MSNKTAWHGLLISAGLTRNSGMDFNKTGDLFLSKLADSDSPGDAAGLLAEYLGAAPVVQSPDAAAPVVQSKPLPLGIYKFSFKGIANQRELDSMIGALTRRKPTEE